MLLLAETWSLMKNQCHKKSQVGASNSSTDSQRKEFEFSDDLNKYVGLDEDSSKMETGRKLPKSNRCNLDC